MSKRAGRRKHVPRRHCVACRTASSKRDLIRLVRTPENEVLVDERGKRNGRGAYLCANPSCWEKALSAHLLDKALRVKLSDKDNDMLLSYASNLQPVENSGE